jgi:hypothetical protein
LKNPDKTFILPLVPASGVSPSPPSAPADGVSISGLPDTRKRVAVYIDGFNLYHAIDNLCEPHLKWVNLWQLGERLMPNRTQYRLVRAYYVSAIRQPGSDKGKRHQQYVNALRHFGVECELSHFISETVSCNKCANTWQDPHEKESDVNLALAVFDDASRDVFELAYLITADSDQAATARMMKSRFPAKQLVSVAPPGMEESKAIKRYIATQKMPKVVLEESLLPASATGMVNGKLIMPFNRPASYAPPQGWLPPSKRPKSTTTTIAKATQAAGAGASTSPPLTR